MSALFVNENNKFRKKQKQTETNLKSQFCKILLFLLKFDAKNCDEK